MKTIEWAGATGDVWAEEWRVTDRSFAPLDPVLVATIVDAAQRVAAPRILEIGCGAGTTSLSIMQALPAARLTGVDVSPALAETARRRTQEAGICNDRARFVAADASRWDEEGGFDLVVSRHGVMFFDDPPAAFANLHGRAAPGGTLVFSCFRAPALNPWASRVASLVPPPPAPPPPFAPGPFAFADPEQVAGLLSHAGWHPADPVPLDYPYVAGAGADPVADALRFFGRIGPASRAMESLEGDDKARLKHALRALVEEYREDDAIVFPAAAWIWTAQA